MVIWKYPLEDAPLGPADNGHDRGNPPSAFYCTKCESHPK
jgi:hypothetical protein